MRSMPSGRGGPVSGLWSRMRRVPRSPSRSSKERQLTSSSPRISTGWNTWPSANSSGRKRGQTSFPTAWCSLLQRELICRSILNQGFRSPRFLDRAISHWPTRTRSRLENTARRRSKRSAFGERVKGRIAQAENVRAALLLVSRGEAPLGIVYESDAVSDPSVVTVGILPDATHPRIIYPIALTSGSTSPDAGGFLDELKSPQARTIFEKQGFTMLN